MAEKNSFILYTKYLTQINMLSAESAGYLFKGIMVYENTGEEIPELESDGMLLMLWSMIKQQLDEDNQKWADTIEKRGEAGKKGGRPKKETVENDEANDLMEKQKKQKVFEESKKSKRFFEKAKKADNEYDNEYDNDINININTPLSPTGENDSKKPSEIDELVESMGFDAVLNKTVRDWLHYKREKRQAYKPVGLKSLLTQIDNNCKKYGSDAVNTTIRESMACNYQGIVWEKLQKSPPKIRAVNNAKQFGAFEQRNIDYDSLERQLSQI